MKFFSDLHLHSKYARGCSKDLVLEQIAFYSKLKGLNLLGTGDFTHPQWLKELKLKLKEVGYGIFTFSQNIYFILTSEINLVFVRQGQVKRMHILLSVPDFDTVEKLNKVLKRFGNLESDGRPTLSLDVKELIDIVIGINEKTMLIPAHIWTPWFSLYGSKSGFDSIAEAFGEKVKYITAVETGLSSNPAMNWRIAELDNYSIVSFSDAHSAYPHRLGREATLLALKELSFDNIYSAFKKPDPENRILLTIEFFPEEGKYHYDGHRICQVRLSPAEAKKFNNICPICYKSLTIGVMHRVESLASREEGFVDERRPGFFQFVPLTEVIAKFLKAEPTSRKVLDYYQTIVEKYGAEFEIILEKYKDQNFKNQYPEIAEIIEKMHKNEIKVLPGYDGEYGQVILFDEKEIPEKTSKQASLF